MSHLSLCQSPDSELGQSVFLTTAWGPHSGIRDWKKWKLLKKKKKVQYNSQFRKISDFCTVLSLGTKMENFGQPSAWISLMLTLRQCDLKESVTSSFGKFAVRFPAITWALPWAYKFLWSLVVWIISWRAIWLKASVYNWKLKSLMNTLLKNMFKQYTFSYTLPPLVPVFPRTKGE